MKAPPIILMGCESRILDCLKAAIGKEREIISVSSVAEAQPRMAGNPAWVALLGSDASSKEELAMLTALVANQRFSEVRLIAIGLAPGEDLVDLLLEEGVVFYQAPNSVDSVHIVALVRSATESIEGVLGILDGQQQPGSQNRRDKVSLMRQFAIQHDLGGMGEILSRIALLSVDGDRAYCLLYDPCEDALWVRDGPMGGERRSRASLGMCGYAFRVGETQEAAWAEQDRRYIREVDDPKGDGTERLLAVPIVGFNDSPAGVLVVVRDREKVEFSSLDCELLNRLCFQAGPHIEYHVDALEDASVVFGSEAPLRRIFRQQAIRSRLAAEQGHAEHLAFSPRRVFGLWNVLVAGLAIGILCSLFLRVDQYVGGPGVIKVAGRTEIFSPIAGYVSSVEIGPREFIKPGQKVVVLRDGRSTIEGSQPGNREETVVVPSQVDTIDHSERQESHQPTNTVEVDRTGIELLTIRAPFGGVVSDLAARPGGYVAPGDSLLAVVSEGSSPYLIAVFPVKFKSSLTEGMELRFKLTGSSGSDYRMKVEQIGSTVVTPEKARRILGAEVADAIQISEPSVVIEASLPSSAVETNGTLHEFFDGLTGYAEVRLGSRRLVSILLPSLTTERPDTNG